MTFPLLFHAGIGDPGIMRRELEGFDGTTQGATQLPQPPQPPQLDHTRAPFAEALHALAHSDMQRAAVPGHLADPERGISAFFGPDLTALDFPPLTDGLDSDPDGRPTPRAQACALAADAWGAQTTWFLTGGATQGNLATCLALATFRPQTTASIVVQRTASIVVQRTMHSSVMDGLALAGLTPHVVMPHVDAERGMAHGLTPASLDTALTAHPDAVAAYVVSPSYFGAVSDIAGLADIAHKHNVPLIVDEAWGAHFGFHSELPTNALRLGADLVISSTHKLGGSLGQSAMLHVGNGPWAADLTSSVERALRMITSTSESSLLLASLDLARRDLVLGADRISASIAAVERIRETLRADARYDIPTDALTLDPAVVAVDPLRLVVDTRGTGLTGHEVRHRLFHDHGVQIEMSTDALIVAVIGAGSTVNAPALLKGLQAMPQSSPKELAVHALPAPGPRAVDLRTATFAASEIIPASAAIGRVSADSLAAYPPGVPNLLPGEVITAETLAFLQSTAAAPHGYVRGAQDPTIETVRVLTDQQF
jgi:arginine/lysine/ornithine decarboxylase